ncbi:MAG: PaaI family thioesterase [Armatimonadetes bacterium]|jgi:acyl-coenzyme A thioesterase PaaI-like protein|nr:PaaI family thioesterase [Armatimonadota bacterium]HOC31971.1 PaaI family thioesterase [Armatimonadota bacterium]
MPDDKLLLKDLRVCIGCGTDNPRGLHLQFEWQGDVLVSHWTPGAEYQGWAGVVHGGMLGLVLDEMMGQIVYRCGHLSPTAELTVRYRQPVPIQKPLTLLGFKPEGRRILLCRAEIRNEAGDLMAEAVGKFLPSPRDTGA